MEIAQGSGADLGELRGRRIECCVSGQLLVSKEMRPIRYITAPTPIAINDILKKSDLRRVNSEG